jgi:lipopolysaccharide export system protein LptA
MVQGEYIMYDANAEYAEVIGGPQAATASNPKGRVRAVIQPKSAKKGASKPADTADSPEAPKQ